MFKHHLKAFCLMTCCFVITALAQATNGTPQEILREVTDAMITRLNAEKEQVQNNPDHVFKLVDEILVPKADFTEMSRRVLARHWRTATPAQRQAFTAEFQTLVIHTYATAFRRYKDEQVEIVGQRSSRGNDNLVEVNTKIKQTEGPDIVVNYRMIKNPAGWRVYDMNVEGVSLVSSFRSQFSDKLRQYGINYVIEDLVKKNQEEAKRIVKRDAR